MSFDDFIKQVGIMSEILGDAAALIMKICVKKIAAGRSVKNVP